MKLFSDEGPKKNARRYSVHNMHKIDIDTATIDITSLDKALSIANEADGTMSKGTRNLLETVKFIRKLRVAMKQGLWLEVQIALEDENDDIGVLALLL